jgi:hypothetical protein
MVISTHACCLLLLPPFAATNPIMTAIVRTLAEAKIDPILRSTGPDRTASIDSIRRADLVVAGVTGGDPNVMFELGVSIAIGKPTLPIVNKAQQSVPSALAGYLFLVYDPAQPENFDFRPALQAWAARHAEGWRGALIA